MAILHFVRRGTGINWKA